MVETIGRRIAYLRQKSGWTQQGLANRLAMSRVAISHIEMDIAIPSERSIILMAGIFKLTPLELVEGTTYPREKSERLPEVANSYTEIEHQRAILFNDVEWLHRVTVTEQGYSLVQQTLVKWSRLVAEWKFKLLDDRERACLAEMSQVLEQLNSDLDQASR